MAEQIRKELEAINLRVRAEAEALQKRILKGL